MTTCVYCGAGTQLYSNGIPICLACVEDLDAGRKPPARELNNPPKDGALAG